MLNLTNITSIESTSAIDRQFWEYFDSEDHRNVSWEEVGRQPEVVLGAYGALLVVGAAGNLAVLVALARNRRRRSRVDLMMTHLAIADVCVTCVVIPLEIGWKYTNAWLVGNLLCKILLVMRAFGLYLSSNVLVCISIDRFFAVLYPLKLSVARRRSKQMLYAAWTIALCCSLPQSAVFRVKQHPYVSGFEQCVSFDAFSSVELEVAYNVFCLCAMYFVPLLIITVCYVCIFFQIRRTRHEINGKYTENCAPNISSVRLRRSDGRMLQCARRRTLRMTVVIVTVFALCWLPYATMAMWYMVDRESASRVSPQVQDLLFAMAVSNSCMNPLVYGSYALSLTGVIQRILKQICCRSTTASDTVGNSGSTSLRNRNHTPDTCLAKSVKIDWKYTNAWLVGNLLCKILLVMRAFGLYLSSNVLVCISIDRFFAVLYPLKLSVARRRSKQMLYAAWTIALCCSLPQSAVFRVKQHPYVSGFEQCVSFDAFSSVELEVAYNVFCLCAMYFVPLLIITVCYVCIFFQIRRTRHEINGKYTENCAPNISSVRLRRSDGRMLQCARRRTLRMTVVIVTVFALCWLPYATMAMWYMVDRESASRVSPQVQDLLFAMAVSNSCMNPLVYGSYALSLTGVIQRILKQICCRSTTASDTVGNSGSTSLRNRNHTPDTCLAKSVKIGWKYTNAWLVGNLLCKILLVMRAFGLYLSSNVLVCISIDRFFAVLYPLKLSVARRRSKQMLYAAWTIALCCSLPQSAVFRVKQHPYVSGFEQCVSFDAFSSVELEVAYSVFCLCAMYFVPLLIITVCYVCIFFQIRRTRHEINGKYTENCAPNISSVRLRRSDGRMLQCARRRTLRMTVVIVTVFALCWLPYATMAMWYMVDRESASRVSPQVQDLLFAMAVSNSCMNPLVYGSYALSLTGVIQRILKQICCRSTTASDTVGNSGSTSLRNRNHTPDTCLAKSVKNGRVRPRLGVRFAEPFPGEETCKPRRRACA